MRASDFPDPVHPATSACGPSDTKSSSTGPEGDIPIRTPRTPEEPRARLGSQPTREGSVSCASARVTVHHHCEATGASSVIHTCAHQAGRRATVDAYPMCTVGRSLSVPCAVRATIGSAHVDVHARMPEEDGCGAVPPDPRPSHLCGNLPCAPQRALRGVCARDTDRCALPRFVHSRGQEDATAHARRTPGPHACPNGTRRGSGVGEPRENQGERRPIPAPASAANSPRERDNEPTQEGHRSRSESDQHPRSARGRTQPPSHESNHDEHGEQGSSTQERRTRQRAPASSLDPRPREAQGAWANLEDVLAEPQASPGCQGLPGAASPPPAQSSAYPKRRGR